VIWWSSTRTSGTGVAFTLFRLRRFRSIAE
jgi:hypothetical protein